ncbi:hypothetical protein [uncultured Aquimarina sp.]|uniref:hypothetical protein n=1 Tax=uncultured Aquimarina sp. TaxID=575652 RepID=UPI002617E688|nr:hypothetical protein [uncultured Aquimarina sp.]
MRKIVLILLCSISLGIYSQQIPGGGNLNVDYSAEITRIADAAKAPEAATLTKFGNTPVSLYTGTPEISIPLYQYSGRELSLPMQLSYDAQGVKVEQQASWVGLSWNLTIGGRVSRIVNGMPDDYISSDYQSIFDNSVRSKVLEYTANNFSFDTRQKAEDYFYFLESVNKGFKDIEQDFFSVNAPGLNEMVVIDMQTLEARGLKNPRTKVEYYRSGYIRHWTITSENGTKYYFEEQEETHTQGNDASATGGVIKEYVSSWLLTKIESPTLKDTYEFSYTSTGYWNQPFSSSPVSHASNPMPNNPGGNTFSNPGGSTFQPITKLNQSFLSQIQHNEKLIVSTVLKNRYDMNLNVPSGLDELHIYSPHSTSPLASILKKIKFGHSYFGISSTANPANSNSDDIRLKLDTVEITDANNNTYQQYALAYDNASGVPSRKSLSQDYMGYYNGKNNSVLYPQYVRNGDTYTGANRLPDFTEAKRGMLTKITYPTGGYTTFTYEQHRASDGSSTGIVTREVVYGGASLTGGLDPSNNNVCGNYCEDKFGSAPKINSTLFTITEPYYYELDYTTSGLGNREAFIFRAQGNLDLGDDRDDNPIIDPDYELTPIPYNQIINQTTGNPSVNLLWSNYGTADRRQILLEAGTYQITLVNSRPGTSNVRIFREEQIDESQSGSEFLKAGLRIQKITDYDNNGTKASAKKYVYASGKVIFNPTLVYTTAKVITTEPDKPTAYTLHRLAGASSNQPHVVYPKITVYDESKQNTSADNGYTIYEFNTGSDGIVTDAIRPFTNSFIPRYKVGKEQRNLVFTAANDTIASTQNSYDNPLYFSTAGISLIHNENNSIKYIQIYYDASTNKYRYRHLEPEWFAGFIGSAGVGGVVQAGNRAYTPQRPSECDAPGATCIERFDLSTLALKRNLMQATAGNTIEVKSTQYFGDTKTTVVDTMSYDSSVDYLMRNSITTGIDGAQEKSTFYYPKDFTDSGSQLLVTNNRLTEVIQSESSTIKESGTTSKLATRKTFYKDWGDGIAFPEKVQFAKGDTTLEDRMYYKKYDTQGNPLEVMQADGTSMIFVWGYQDRYPVAKIVNASYDNLSTNVVNLINEIRTETNTQSEEDIRGLLDDLREALPNAQVSTYTYKPLVGVTSMTDPRGYTMYYEYDTFHRLTKVKDQSGNILSENQYNYINN